MFQVVDRLRRLRYSTTMRMPDGSSFDTEVEVVLEEEGPGRTRLTILQTGFPTGRLRDEIASGWPSILDGLGRVVAARSGPPGAAGR